MNRESKMDINGVLPEECISHIISLTTPRDACRTSTVCHAFKSYADSDSVWEKFLPSDYKDIISTSPSASSFIASLSKKDLYFHLSRNPIIINDGTMSFALEKESGKKCYMVGARGLCIAWGERPNYWKWTHIPESRFPEVAELKSVFLVAEIDVKARIKTRILSSGTNYAAYLVFKFAKSRYGFQRRSLVFGVYVEGSHKEDKQRRLFLDPSRNMPRVSQDRGDGWMEIEMGEFFNENGDDGMLVCSLFDFDRYSTKHGLIIQGIELRPKNR